MKDGVIKGNGTSRLIRATLPASYEELRAQAAAGTLLADIIFNAAGWSVQPDFLNKENLLQDETAALFGLGSDAVPQSVFQALTRALFNDNGLVSDIGGNVIGLRIATGSYVGSGNYGESVPARLTFDFAPKFLAVIARYTTGKGYEERLMVLPYGATYVTTKFSGASSADAATPPVSGTIAVSGWGTNTIYWYGGSASVQMTASACTYHWVAIG